MPCLDTSLLVAGLTREARTAAVQDWLAAQASEALVISDWVVTEFSSALPVKVRMKRLDDELRAEVLAAFTSLVNESLTVLTVTSRDFGLAARFADDHRSGLRAGDALHLAVAAHHGLQVLSLDKIMVKAAVKSGVSARLFGQGHAT